MPEYVYRCENCEYEFETFQSIKDKKLKKCPECRKLKLERVIQPTLGFVKLCDSELKTVGHISSRNRDKFSNDYKTVLKNKQKTKRNSDKLREKGINIKEPKEEKILPVFDDGVDMKKLVRASPKEKENYIYNGVMPK